MPSLNLPKVSLDQLKATIGKTRNPGLSDDRFDQAHECFERSSNQQNLILRWLSSFATDFPCDGPLNILSVGCGSGILDLPILQALASKQRQTRYTGIDPNRVACKRFRDGFRKSKQDCVELTVREETVETLSGDGIFDIIHAVHSLYYFQDPAAAIRQLLKRMRRDGRLIILQAPKAELNQLSACFWFHDQEADIWFSDQLEKHLEISGYKFKKSRIDGQIDVTSCFDPNSPKGALILDFITQVNCQTLEATSLELLLGYLRAIASVDDRKTLVPHPVDVFEIIAT